jgi:hypothetical protein
MAMISYYPLSTKEELLKHFVGKSIKNVPAPAAVLDLSKVVRVIAIECWKLLIS